MRMIVFVGLLLSMFSIGVMQLILATALPFIVAETGGAELYGWVFSGYMLASLFTIPLFSKLADIYGKRRFFLLGTVLFALGSLYGGFASSMLNLVAARVLQGLGAGMITPVALAMVSDLFGAEKRGQMIGIFAFVQLLANLLSPPFGSFITKQIGWSWIFFLNCGLLLLSGLFVAFGGRRHEHTVRVQPAAIDITGGLVFGLFCVLAVSFSNLVSQHGYANAGTVLVLALLLAAAVVLFVAEKRHPNPVIKISFFKTKVIRRSILSSVLAGGIMYGLVTVLPLCGLILSRHGSRLNESSLLLVFMIGITSGLLAGSRLVGRIQFRHLTRLLWIVMTAGAALMLYALPLPNPSGFAVCTVLVGLCTGGIMATFLINSQNAINDEDRTVLSGLIQLGRYFGASIGVTLFTGIVPTVGQLQATGQFAGAFILLAVISVFGFVNEFV